MIEVVFRSLPQGCTLSVSGHAGYAERGRDIVCAAVTSAVQLTFNGITEVLGLAAEVTQLENELSIGLNPAQAVQADGFLQAFLLHVRLLAEEYPNTIRIITEEHGNA